MSLWLAQPLPRLPEATQFLSSLGLPRAVSRHNSVAGSGLAWLPRLRGTRNTSHTFTGLLDGQGRQPAGPTLLIPQTSFIGSSAGFANASFPFHSPREPILKPESSCFILRVRESAPLFRAMVNSAGASFWPRVSTILCPCRDVPHPALQALLG